MKYVRGPALPNVPWVSPVPVVSSGSEPLYFVHTLRLRAANVSCASRACAKRDEIAFGSVYVPDTSRRRQNWPFSRYPYGVVEVLQVSARRIPVRDVGRLVRERRRRIGRALARQILRALELVGAVEDLQAALVVARHVDAKLAVEQVEAARDRHDVARDRVARRTGTFGFTVTSFGVMMPSLFASAYVYVR